MKQRLNLPMAVACYMAFGFLVPVASATAYKEGPKIGDTPPSLKLTRILDGPQVDQISWDKLRGNVVVLEFWAISCGPCVQAIPHLNQLVDEFKDRPVRFITVTSDNVGAVKVFLQKHPINAWMGFDEFEEMRQAFAVAGIPHAVIVNAEGRIAAITHPAKLEAKHLEEILAGHPCSLPQPKPYEDDFVETETVPAARSPVFEISIRPSGRTQTKNGACCSWTHSRDRCEYTGGIATIESALLAVFDRTQPYLFIEGNLPEGFYDFKLKVPPGHPGELKQLFADTLRTSFGLDVRQAMKEMEVYRLIAVTTNAPGLQPTSERGGGGQTAGGFDLLGSRLEIVIIYLETSLRQPIVNESGLQGLFNAHLRWDMTDAELLPGRVSYKVIEALEKNPTQATLDSLPAELLKGDTRNHARSLLVELQKPKQERFRPDPAAVIKAVREQFGLKLEPVRRTIQVVTVRKVEP